MSVMKFRGDRTGFYFTTFVVHLRAVDEVELPQNSGSTFRGAFGAAFRKKVECGVKGDCSVECPRKDQCYYYRYFLRTRPGDKTPVRPYIIEPPQGNSKVIRRGEQIRFNLTLVGESSETIPVLEILEEMGKCGLGRRRGRCFLEAVYSLGDGDPLPVYLRSSGNGCVNKPIKRYWAKFFGLPEVEVNWVGIRFLTPARLVEDDRLVSEVPFHILVHRLLSRIRDLDREYCGDKLDLPVDDLVRIAENEVKRVKQDKEQDKQEWYDWGRYSLRQGSYMKFGGVCGEIEYRGNLSPFIPYLLIGEYIHVGKQSTFGNGRFKLYILR